MAERRPNRQSSTSTSSSRNTASTLAGDSRNSIRYSNPDIFSDEFALEPLEIADGFRPPSPDRDATPSVPASRPSRSERQPRDFQPLAETPLETFRRINGSQLQPFGRGNSFASRHDARTSHREPSMASVSDISNLPQRTISTGSTFTIPRTQSPYQGAMGPSHPYGMYPQDISLTRTPSAATYSTTRAPDRLYAGPNGPTHPYGMYPQNTVPEGVVSPLTEEAPPIPVGFPGLGQNYRRRFGPEGEEADDIIGPDGHTEQLPPYTRFPDAFLAKQDASEAAGAGATLQSQPETSQTTLNNSQSRLFATPTLNADDARPPLIPAGLPNGSGSFKERWSEKGKKRFCNGKVPMWILIVITVIFIVLLGGLIGGMVEHKHEGHQGDHQVPQAIQTTPLAGVTVPSTVIATITATTAVDATPLSSIPPNLPLMPTGTFGVPLNLQTESSNSCLTNASQNSAWGCAPVGYLGIDVTVETEGPNQVTLTSTVGQSVPIHYGAQTPGLDSPCSLFLMWDKLDLGRGPAYFFEHQFDKVVIVPESVFSAGTSKRWLDEDGDYENWAPVEERDWPRERVINAGDKPWYCVWNNTVLEGFIYLEQNTTAANTSLASAPSATSAPASVSVHPGGQIASAMIASASAFVASSIPSIIPREQKRDQASSDILPYPKVVKIEERRNLVNNVQPYCQQMHIPNTMVPAPVMDSNGNPVIVNLTESEPITDGAVQGHARTRRTWAWGRSRENKRQIPFASSCYCEWLSE